MSAAKHHAEAGRESEAWIMSRAVARINPDAPGMKELEATASQEMQDVYKPSALGSNRAKRLVVKRSIPARIALYLPDRVLDFLDLASFDVHLGPGVYLDAHVTRGIQLAAGTRAVGGFGWHEHRSLGGKAQAEAGINVLAAGAHAFAGSTAGTSGIHGGSQGIAGIHSPGLRLYQDYRDFWAIGVSATAVLLGVEADIHPVQIVDFVAGFVGADICRDDFAHTRGPDLTGSDREILMELGRIQSSRTSLQAYWQEKGVTLPAE
jgi:hypothetical protein